MDFQLIAQILETKLSCDYCICEPTSLLRRIIIHSITIECLKGKLNILTLKIKYIINVINCFINMPSISVLEINPGVSKFVTNRNYLLLGWNGCFIEEYYQLICYFQRIKFSSLKIYFSKLNRICPECSGCNERKDCKSQSKICPNYKFHNTKHNRKWPTDHSASSHKFNFFELKNKIQYE